MSYQLTPFNRNVPESDLLEDLRSVAQKVGSEQLSSREYDANGGKYASSTIGLRFGSWNNALKQAGLSLVHQRDVSADELFENLEKVWLLVGKQPVFRDMKPPTSKYSTHQYVTRFGTWRKALEAFIIHIGANNNGEASVAASSDSATIQPLADVQEYKHKTKRNPSGRLKVQVLIRDGNKCRLCGVTVTGENIHFDHILPWSKRGETVLENLQVLCAEHNLAKGDLMSEQ